MDAHSSDTAAPAMVPHFELKPIIKELVRTQVCFPNLKLLIDKVSIVVLPKNEHTTGTEAYRLLLTDGEKTIQALLKRRIYKTITNFGIGEGSYVVLKEYHLAKAKKLVGGGTAIYIVIDDFYTIGEEERENVTIDHYYQYTSSSKDGSPGFALRQENKNPLSLKRSEDERNDDVGVTFSGETDNENNQVEEVSLLPIPPPVYSTSYKRKRETPLEENTNLASRWSSAARLAQELEGASGKISTASSSQRSSFLSDSVHATPSKRRRTQSQPRPKESDDIPADGQNKHQSPAFTHAVRVRPTAPSPSRHRTPLEKERSSAESPLKNPTTNTTSPQPLTFTFLQPTSDPPPPLPHPLVPLSHIATHHLRTTTFSILALIHSVSPSITKPPRLPPKRDLRIVDPSTDKKVLLSVFVNPERFKPDVGTVMLFRSLTSHEWDGGMLNAYLKMRQEGRGWYVVEPEGYDVKGLREWWVGKYGGEAKKAGGEG